MASDEEKEATKKRDDAKGLIKEAVAEWFSDQEEKTRTAAKEKKSGNFLDGLFGG